MINKPIELSEFVVPASTDTEILMIAEMISLPECILDVRKIISEEMFTYDKAKETYNIILKKADNREQIDLTTIWMACDKEFFSKEVIPYTMRGGATLTGAVEHAKVIKELYMKRMAYFSALKMLQMIKDDADSTTIMSHSKRLQDDMTNAMKVESVKTMTEAINELMDDLQKGATVKIPTGIRWLDYYTYGGFGAGELIILAARPSVGKTALALQIANEMARQEKYVDFFSLEMTNRTLAKRTLLATNEVKSTDFFYNTDWDAMERAIKGSTSDYFLMDDESVTLDSITAKMEALNREGRCDVAFIDYLGLIKITRSTGSLNRDLGEITGSLKRLAKKLGIPIVLLCQLNRTSASEGRPPQLYDLRDSGSIENDADVVIMLEKPQDFDSENEELPRINLWLRKNRENKRDISVELTGSKTYTCFHEA